ncbi:MAG: hypothetical protein MUD14_13115 [Hydrococcus sp. Prado102]|nr:hypothetical protein [Hydrococcus sp. Prado102]
MTKLVAIFSNLNGIWVSCDRFMQFLKICSQFSSFSLCKMCGKIARSLIIGFHTIGTKFVP